MTLPDPPRQCRARYDSDQSLRCQEMVTEATTHVGVVPHWAINRRGETVRWAQDRSFYPVFDSDPLMAEQVREDVASSLANPTRVLVGEPGPELCNCGPGEHTLTGTCLPVGNGSARLAQVGGDHYRKFKIQPWDVIDEYGLSFYAGNALKYLLRAGHKSASPLEDLKKCRHYLDKLIELEADDGQA